MTESRRSATAWSVFAASMFVAAVGTILWAANARHVPGVFSPQTLVVPTYGAVGAVVVARRGHVLGWLFLAFAAVAAVTMFAFEYSVAAYGGFVTGLPKIPLLAWLQQELWPVNFVFLGMLLLLFPDGRTASRFFRRVLVALVVAWGLADLGGGLLPEPVELLSGRHSLSVPNPFMIRVPRAPYDALMTAIFLAAILTMILAAASPVVKWRRGNIVTREQIRWPAFVVVVSLLGFIAAVVLAQAHLVPADSPIGMTPLIGGAAGLPIAIGISILRYRLYEIDRIVNRAVVYAMLTAVLAGTYVLIVFALRSVLGRFAGSSHLAVAASTLAVAALFQPGLKRTQTFIDRRFYRRRFDATKTVEEFGSHLRDEIDLDELSANLVEVVAETMQPAHVSLWLRKPQGGAA